MRCSHCKKRMGLFTSYYKRNNGQDKIHTHCITEYDSKKEAQK